MICLLEGKRSVLALKDVMRRYVRTAQGTIILVDDVVNMIGYERIRVKMSGGEKRKVK